MNSRVSVISRRYTVRQYLNELMQLSLCKQVWGRVSFRLMDFPYTGENLQQRQCKGSVCVCSNQVAFRCRCELDSTKTRQKKTLIELELAAKKRTISLLIGPSQRLNWKGSITRRCCCYCNTSWTCQSTAACCLVRFKCIDRFRKRASSWWALVSCDYISLFPYRFHVEEQQTHTSSPGVETTNNPVWIHPDPRWGSFHTPLQLFSDRVVQVQVLPISNWPNKFARSLTTTGDLEGPVFNWGLAVSRRSEQLKVKWGRASEKGARAGIAPDASALLRPTCRTPFGPIPDSTSWNCHRTRANGRNVWKLMILGRCSISF